MDRRTLILMWLTSTASALVGVVAGVILATALLGRGREAPRPQAIIPEREIPLPKPPVAAVVED